MKLATALIVVASPLNARAESEVVPVAGDPAHFSESPRLFRDVDGRLHVVHRAIYGGRSRSEYVTSADSGRTWSPSVVVADSTQFYFTAGRSRPVVQGDRVLVAWENTNAFQGGLWLAQKAVTDFAFTSTPIEPMDADPRLISLVGLSTGRLVCHFAERSPEFVFSHFVIVSDDQGASWTSRQAVNALVPAGSSKPLGSLAVGPNDEMYVTLFGQDSRLYCYRSVDHGETWTRHEIATLPGSPPASSIAVSETGLVGVAWEQNVDPPMGQARRCLFASSQDQGNTWSIPEPFPDGDSGTGVYYKPILRATSSGGWHCALLWNIPLTNTVDLYHVQSTDGVDWSTPTMLNTGNVDPWVHDFVVDDDGFIYNVWAQEAVIAERLVVFRTNAPVLVPVVETSWSALKSRQ